MSSALAFRRHAVIWAPLLSALPIVAGVAIYGELGGKYAENPGWRTSPASSPSSA